MAVNAASEEPRLFQGIDFSLKPIYLQSSTSLYSPHFLILLPPPISGRIPTVKKKKVSTIDLFKAHFPKCDAVIEGV